MTSILIGCPALCCIQKAVQAETLLITLKWMGRTVIGSTAGHMKTSWTQKVLLCSLGFHAWTIQTEQWTVQFENFTCAYILYKTLSFQNCWTTSTERWKTPIRKVIFCMCVVVLVLCNQDTIKHGVKFIVVFSFD